MHFTMYFDASDSTDWLFLGLRHFINIIFIIKWLLRMIVLFLPCPAASIRADPQTQRLPFRLLSAMGALFQLIAVGKSAGGGLGLPSGPLNLNRAGLSARPAIE
ncbi:MAG TPA: hypothetical protein VI381_04085 [Allosphingosinicella sp.]